MFTIPKTKFRVILLGILALSCIVSLYFTLEPIVIIKPSLKSSQPTIRRAKKTIVSGLSMLATK